MSNRAQAAVQGWNQGWDESHIRPNGAGAGMSPAPGPQCRPWRPGRGRAASTRGRRRPGDMRARASTQDTCHPVTDERDKRGKTALSPNTNRTRSLASVTRGEDRSGGAGRGPGGSGRASHHHHPHAGVGTEPVTRPWREHYRKHHRKHYREHYRKHYREHYREH